MVTYIYIYKEVTLQPSRDGCRSSRLAATLVKQEETTRLPSMPLATRPPRSKADSSKRITAHTEHVTHPTEPRELPEPAKERDQKKQEAKPDSVTAPACAPETPPLGEPVERPRSCWNLLPVNSE